MNSAPVDTEAKLLRAKERLYVLGQSAGWGFFLLMQLLFIRFFERSSPAGSTMDMVARIAMVVAMGLLLTHYARTPIERWGWKEMSWRKLFPRIIALALLLSMTWSVLGYGFTYGVLQDPWPKGIHPFALLLISILNGAIMMVGWLCIYFFYHVYERLQRLQVEQLRLAASAKEAELRALKSQVNPHFLFNSLNSLRALIEEDAPRARESVTRLANMLRYSLQSGQLETVPFDEELRIVEDYLALEQIRHENRLQVRWEIAANVHGHPLPPMLLQTLVENAVKYGISPRRSGGEIVISASCTDHALHLRVTNPGDLNAPTSHAAAKAGSSTGVGLRNASERLKLLYGDRAKLTLLAESPERVAASLIIPLPEVP
ncbi:MAG: histidine kinase [Candidatus Didemnitutus sp.]|nr:histidine kinase [Candidatus Didemnitutus sp.]